MPRKPRWQNNLATAREEATLAARLYNDPLEPRCLESFIVHMHLAWLYLLHATFIRDGVDFRYRDIDHPHLLARIDGEVKLWGLSKCVKEHFAHDSPVKHNIDFFVALRNKIEHRHLRADENISLSVSGKAQSLLLNFEKELVKQFGETWTLATALRAPLFIGTFTTAGEQTLLELQKSIPGDLKNFLSSFDGALSEEILMSPEYEIRIKVILQSAQRGSDALAIKFVRVEELDDEQLKAYDILQKAGIVIIKDRHQSVANLDKLRPSLVVKEVCSRIPFDFKIHHHTEAWKRHKVRPESGAGNPRKTNQKYCIYDEAHKDYLYTQQWVDRVAQECQTANGFASFIGIPPVQSPKSYTPQT